MAYAAPGNEIGTLRFLFANVVYQGTQALLNAEDEQDADVLNDMVLLGDAIASYLTESDSLFVKEWSAIQKDRLDPKKAPYAPGEDRGQDQGFRWRELKAMIRSMARMDQLVKHASASVEWTPQVKA